METRNIFIDTQAYHQENFRFDGLVLSKVERLGEAGELKVLYSSIVYNEVLSKNKKNI